jgi:pimeloyl-ACP methyl ester carboxylesterase
MRTAHGDKIAPQTMKTGRGEFAMPYFSNGNVSLHYLERGRGEALVLIHGLGSSGADWAFQVAALEKRFRVIVPDLPGSGHSPPPRDEYDISGFASALWSLLDHLQVSRTYLIGFSLGGAVALEMAAQRPASVPRLGLINSLATYRPDDWRKWLEVHVSATLVHLLGMPNASLLALLTDQPLPPQARWIRDTPARAQALSLTGSIAEEHALGLTGSIAEERALGA